MCARHAAQRAHSAMCSCGARACMRGPRTSVLVRSLCAYTPRTTTHALHTGSTAGWYHHHPTPPSRGCTPLRVQAHSGRVAPWRESLPQRRPPPAHHSPTAVSCCGGVQLLDLERHGRAACLREGGEGTASSALRCSVVPRPFVSLAGTAALRAACVRVCQRVLTWGRGARRRCCRGMGRGPSWLLGN